MDSATWTQSEIRLAVLRPRVLTWHDWPIPEVGGHARFFFGKDSWRKGHNAKMTTLFARSLLEQGLIHGPVLALGYADGKLRGLETTEMFMVASALVFAEQPSIGGSS
jgi:hypothetical protein